jgi:4-amino-4-deoxy-L-arabinose transferase-like glycosyltransferase
MARPLVESARRLLRPAPVVVALIIAYGTLLRFDVLVQRYGTVAHPLWARVLTQTVGPVASRLHPPVYRWYHVDRPYQGGDPINYIKYAREMRSFYQAHVREPVFLALTRMYLWLLADQDVAVSFASATGSILTILAAYLLGAAVVSRTAGVAVALLVAIEYDLISWSVDGWRDDLFMAGVTFSAWAFVRCQREPSRRNAVVLGVAAAAACLTRITALSFAVPGFAWLVVDHGAQTRSQRARMAIAAALLCAVIVAPYLINCAIATGDPLYAINYHTVYYRHGEGLPSEQPMTAAAYLRSKIAAHPIAALDTAMNGLFVQPFTTKWNGFDGWIPHLSVVLSSFAVAGLLSWFLTPTGRLMLVILVGSLVPYALTWNVAGGGEWRFTMHAYPLYLVATMSGIAVVRTAIVAARHRRFSITRRRVLTSVAGVVVMVAAWASYSALPWFVVRETIASGSDVSVEAGKRDAAFFASGWSAPYADGMIFRVSNTERAIIRLPLPARRAYQIVLRLDPVSPDQQHRAVVLLNKQLLATLLLTWNSDRVGSYPLLLPADKVRVGMNELTIVPDTLVSAGSAGARYASRDPGDRLGVRLWYVRVLAPPSMPVSPLRSGLALMTLY